jgi:hypothetical protein
MSTGAWVFTGLVAAAVIAPVAVYSAATSTVAIGTTSNSTTANITGSHQLLTTTVAPNSVIHLFASATGGGQCTPYYTPPAGKAIMVTSVTYDLGNGTAGDDEWAELRTVNCGASYDIGDTTQGFEAQQHTWPTGLPMPSIGFYVGSDEGATIAVTGYLIPVGALPAATSTMGSANAQNTGKLHGLTSN